MFIFLKSKKQSLHSEKKVNKDTIVLEVCSPWTLTRFRWEKGPGFRNGMEMEGKAQGAQRESQGL